MPASPSVDNYAVLKATTTFEATALGNTPEIELTPEFETLDHESSQAGVKSIDKTVVVSKKVSLRIVGDEYSEHNVRLALLAAATGSPINIYSQAEREGEIVITQTNQVGPKYVVTLPSVSFTPSGSFPLISDEFGTWEIVGNVNAVAGVFGTIAAVV